MHTRTRRLRRMQADRRAKKVKVFPSPKRCTTICQSPRRIAAQVTYSASLGYRSCNFKWNPTSKSRAVIRKLLPTNRITSLFRGRNRTNKWFLLNMNAVFMRLVLIRSLCKTLTVFQPSQPCPDLVSTGKSARKQGWIRCQYLAAVWRCASLERKLRPIQNHIPAKTLYFYTHTHTDPLTSRLSFFRSDPA